MTNILILALFVSLGTTNILHANGRDTASALSEYQQNAQILTKIKNTLISNLNSNNIYAKYIESSKAIIKNLEELLKDAANNNKVLEGEYITSLISLSHKALSLYLIKN